jgi:hypothetical protein
MLNITKLAPTPIASDKIATEAKTGLARSDPLKTPRGPRLFAHPRTRPELAARSPQSLRSWHTFALQFFHPHLEVEFDFLFQLAVELRALTEVQQPAEKLSQARHLRRP